jgi:phosphatidylglycerophosphate synthase
MTAIERWRKGILRAICLTLVLALSNYLFPHSPVNQYWACFAVGFAFLWGWLDGSAAERKSNRVHMTS